METKITKHWEKKGSKGETYKLTIKFLMESKEIYWMDCTCPDFSGLTKNKNGNPKLIGSRRIKGIGEFADKKYYAEPCKHLQPLINFYEKEYGFKLKKPKEMEGTDNPTKALLNALISRSGGLCEANCGRMGKHIHRKIRGSNGGKYSESNCVYLCPECHRRIHSNEFSGSKSR